ncbi:MAG TPA: hypothetical protein VD789_01935 [Thermomicrobiales bacterium]|nr:hypothetical protein [Thermomicrobiales bacterium]
MRRFITMAALAYLLVAFGFILLIVLNGSDEGEIVAIAEADAGVIVTMCALGMLVTCFLGIRMVIDSKRRHDLERMFNEPRRKSDAIARHSRPE